MSDDTRTPEEQLADLLELNKNKELSNKLRKEALELELKIAQALGDQREIEFNQAELRKQELETLIGQLSEVRLSQIEGSVAQQEHLDKINQYKEELYEINKQLDIGRKAAQESDKFWGSISGRLFMGRTALDNIADKATTLSERMKDNDEYAKQFAISFKKSFSLGRAMSNVLMTIVASTAKIAMQADQLVTAFAAATGFGDKYKNEIIDAGQAHRDLGIGIKQSQEAYLALVTGTTNFVQQSADTRKELAAQAAGLARMGVDLGTTSELIQTFNLSLGQTQSEALKSIERIAIMGTNLGLTSKQMTKDYQASLSVLMVYGDRSIGVFEGLATSARAAGVEVGSLLKLAGQFDTFAGAAETTGKLNAILGTQLSATEMLLQTEDKRLETLIGTIQATGMAFGDMDRFTQKAVANAAGITDMNEAARIFGMNMAEFKSHRAEMAETEASQQRMAEAIKATVSIQEMLTITFSEFAVALKPVLEGVRSFLSLVMEILEEVPEGGKEIIGGALAFGFMLKMAIPLVGVLAGLGKGLGLITVAAPSMTGALGALGAALAGFGQAIAAGLGPLAIFAGLIAGLVLAYTAYVGAKSMLAEQEAREQEAIAKQIEAYSQLGSASAGVSALRSELNAFKDIDVDAKATLTNLAFISAGKAAEAGTNAIIDGRNFDIQNNLENVFKPTIEIKIDGEAMGTLMEGAIYKVNQ